MLVTSLVLSLAYAEQKLSGVGLAGIAVRSSAGNHRIHAGVSGWHQQCLSARDICWSGQIDAGFNRQMVPNGRMNTSVVRPRLTVGKSFGQQRTTVGFFAGSGVQIFTGGAESTRWLFQPTGYGKVVVQRPFGEQWLCALENGYSVTKWYIDPDLSLSVGWRW